MIKVGIIGTGVMGAGHARFINKHLQNALVIALSDIDTTRMASLATELSTIELQTTNPAELMNSELVDAIIIASPDPLHVEHLELAINSGKPTLCEKPIATNLDDARKITKKIRDYQELTKETRIHFGFMRRFDPSYRKVKELIDRKSVV